jgi:hypothetical protein
MQQHNQRYAQQSREKMRDEAVFLMHKIRSTIKEGTNAGALTTPQEIHGVMKKELVECVDQSGLNDGTMRLCRRARGLLLAEYNPAITQPIEIENPATENVWVHTVDGAPRALYVAEGECGTASIWKKHHENWEITDRIELKDKPFVRYVRAIQSRTRGLADSSERVAIEFKEMKGNRSLFGLSVYAKQLAVNGHPSVQPWRKELANIETNEFIIAYAFSEGAQHCAMITRKNDFHTDRLTFYERRNNHYDAIGSQEIQRGVEQLMWRGDTLIINSKDAYNKIDLSFGKLLPMSPVTDREQIKNMVLEKLLGVRSGRANDHSKIFIHDPLPMLARYLADVSAQKRLAQANKEKSQSSSLTNSPDSSALSVSSEIGEPDLKWLPPYTPKFWSMGSTEV